ncbi:MAG: PAS domain-containing protein [Chitinophagaceae bacterium]|nr:PAS domain-containing protein [Chitinophagaceae bacterium]
MITEKKAFQTGSCVVGIGASAGGMEALNEFFDNTRPDSGFSFIVVQHLSPDYKSLMSELLAKRTMMQVFEAQEDMPVQPNCVYVIPSKKLLTIKDGYLCLDEKKKSHLPNNAIDVFFESLAIDQKEKAIGIILSGTGTDGSKGIELIKKHKGVVVVQDPVTAAFDGMPNSAIATGCADLVLAPEMMMDEISEYLKDVPVLKTFADFSQKDELILRELLNGVKQITGNDFSHYKRPTLVRRLAKRMMEVGINTIEDYKTFVQNKQDELKVLGKEFLINVTRFFRDTEAFDFLRTTVLPDIVAGKQGRDQIKVWSMACSTGEEAYSLAILFSEVLGKEKMNELQVKIFATDIDQQCLETASRGQYGKQIEKEVPPELLSKYFIHEESAYRVSPDIRKLVVFAKHDILKDPPLSKMDLVLCRNMLIYFDNFIQAKALQKIHFALNIDSYLFLGSSENIGTLSSAMKEVSRKWKIFRCISKTNVIESNVFVMPFGNKINLPAEATQFNPLKNLGEMFRDTLTELRAIAGILIDKDFNVKHAIGAFKNFLQFPEESFHFNLLKMVPSDLSVALGVHIRKAIATDEVVVARNLTIHEKNSSRCVNIIVKPYLHIKNYPQPLLFVVLEEVEKPGKRSKKNTIVSESNTEQLEKELRESRENLQAIIEELESANEELQSNNEEMISTNEELQSTNEELQSLNEELHTVSAEHQAKIKELLDLNDDLDNYFRNLDTGQVFVDRRLLIKKFSPTITSVINLIGSDIGRSLVDITNNINDRNFINDIKEVINSGDTIEKEVVLDNHRFFLVRINPYWKRDRTVDGAVINFTDITESKKLTGIIEGVFNSSTNGIAAKKAVRDEKGKIVDFEFLAANTSYSEMFQRPINKLIGKRLTEIFPDIPKEHIDLYADVVNTGKTGKLERYMPTEDKWFEAVVVKMYDGIVSTHTDITEKKKAAETIATSYQELKNTSEQLIDSNTQLERSNMDLMQFASVASHDLKEPLRKIQVFGNILTDKLKDKFSSEDLKYLSKITNASRRMQVLIEDVLTLSKLSNSDQLKSEVDLKKTIQRILDDLEITISERNAVIQVSDLPHIQAVPGQMHQVFQNLISNALKFNDKKTPRISISEKELPREVFAESGLSGQADQFVCIEVTDNGIGFEQQYTDKIFGIFQRLNGRQFDGTGIGLAIVKKIIETHGGAIKASSEPGKWTSFTIVLPK